MHYEWRSSKWETIFKDPMTTAAAIDWLVHHRVILELYISSYRLETASGPNKSRRRTPREGPPPGGDGWVRFAPLRCAKRTHPRREKREF